MNPENNRRILLVDDNSAIHEDFRKILAGSINNPGLDAAEALLFGTVAEERVQREAFETESAFQGREALEKVERALAEGRRFALAFVDGRMPPGWDGIETIEQLWRVDPALQVVLCTAYSDYSWEKMSGRLGINDNLVILKKPFDNIEVVQLAHALTRKWHSAAQAGLRMETLERMVGERTSELTRSEERFAKAFQAIPIPLAIQTFREDRFVDVNKAFERMSGLSRGELLGKTPLELGLEIVFEPLSRQQLHESTVLTNVQAEIRTRSGEMRQGLVSIEPISLTGEAHVLVMIEDITERLRLETQMRQSQKMEAIGQLAAGIAHDFNNLLTIIQGNASLQLTVPGSREDVSEAFTQIEQAAERAAELTRQLLTFSRRQILRPRVVNLNSVVRNLTSMLQRLIGAQIKLSCELEEPLKPVLADRTSLEQIIMNLAVNARDAMPTGGTITLSTRRVKLSAADCEHENEATPGEFVRLSVSDTGIGMDAATCRRIFEPFFTTKEIDKGTGMGLATVYGVVKQHKGWIDVITAPGKGATFQVFLPVTHRAEDASDSAPAVRPGSGREHTLLVVEDEDAVRSLVCEILIADGYRILDAANAEEALVIWNAQGDQVSLLLTDVVMPGAINGLQLARTILAQRPSLKVIFTSGYSSDLFSGDVKLEEGVNYLPKPYLSSKLLAILRNAL